MVFVRDVRSVAGRALRQIPREPASVLPAVLRAGFLLHREPRSSRESGRRRAGFSYKAFPHPHGHRLCRHRNVEGPDTRDRHPRWVLRPTLHDTHPPHRPAARAHGGRHGRDRRSVRARAGIGFGVGVRFATGLRVSWPSSGSPPSGDSSFTGFPYAVALKTGSPAAVNACLRRLLPPVLPERCRGAQAGADGLVLDHRHLQPGDLPPRCSAIPHHLGVADPYLCWRDWPPCRASRWWAWRWRSRHFEPGSGWGIELDPGRLPRPAR